MGKILDWLGIKSYAAPDKSRKGFYGHSIRTNKTGLDDQLRERRLTGYFDRNMRKKKVRRTPVVDVVKWKLMEPRSDNGMGGGLFSDPESKRLVDIALAPKGTKKDHESLDKLQDLLLED